MKETDDPLVSNEIVPPDKDGMLNDPGDLSPPKDHQFPAKEMIHKS